MIIGCRRRNAIQHEVGGMGSVGKPKRLTYVESVAVLKSKVDIMGDALPTVTRTPRYDDEKIGPSIFRMKVEDVSLDGLTLLGLYVGRSELSRLSFKATDLHLCAFNWSDIIKCDFSSADLSHADLRACHFVSCSFAGAILTSADLRGSTFVSSTFTDADLRGALLYRRPETRKMGAIVDQTDLPLTPEQRRLVDWSGEAPEPGGG
jgi:uncharacterized protein YjbI with pentapeptide repeats